jgi:pyridoxamine 5'-phosphate oxidase
VSIQGELAATLAEAWRLVALGVDDVGSPFHAPTIATVDEAGAPRLRTVILRACDPAGRVLRFHTDIRSAKVGEIRRRPRVAVHVHDPVRRVQVQFGGTAEIMTGSGTARAAWNAARLGSRACYGVEPGPGAVISRGDGYRLPAEEAGILAGFDNFAAIETTVDRLEWLLLDRGGHRRVLFTWTGGGWDGCWLVP